MNQTIFTQHKGVTMKRSLLVALALLGASAWGADTLDLAGEWRAGLVLEQRLPIPLAEFPYRVPGGIQSALLKAKLIPDTYIGTNEVENLWIGKSDWNVWRTFEVSPDFLSKREIILRLEDCDAFATIYVNDEKVGETTDRFQRYEFDVKKFLKPGKNEIKARFRSPEKVADERREFYGRDYPINCVFWAKNQALVRKPACHAGWDWGPSVQVIGFCGTTELIASDTPRINYVYSKQDFNADFTHCTLTVFADLSDGSTVSKKIEIENPPLWWPNGAGEQKFYEYEIEVAGETLKRRIGLRKVEVLNERTFSKDGKEELSLVFCVNGRRLFMRGADWIPCSAYENEQTPERYRDLVKSARDANMNMIRVWGGGQYEKDAFYDACDEYGILLWHDMMCSCAVYPATPEFLGEIRAELVHQLRRLRDHACIAMWCGDNECLGANKWFEVTRKDPEFYRNGWIKRSKMQAEVLAKYDPTRTYWPTSPCCGPGDFGDGWKEDSKGDMHNWDVWHENQPFSKYYEYHPRFCSEFGFQSFPSMEIAETFATKDEILSRAQAFEWHQKNIGGNERIRKTMERYFPTPKNVPAELLISQFQQAMAIQTAVDAWRAEQPRCMGTLFWQLNDNWPVSSWSSIEYGGPTTPGSVVASKWKPLQYLARRFYEPVHVVVAPDGTVSVINDTEKPLFGNVTARFFNFDGNGTEDVRICGSTEIAANAATKVGKVERRKDAVMQLVFAYADKVDATDLRFATNFPVLETYRGIALPKAKVEMKVDGFSVTLTTDKPAFWVWLNAKGVKGRFDDNAVTLVPGEPRTFVFAPADPKTTPEQFRKALSVTDLVSLSK